MVQLNTVKMTYAESKEGKIVTIDDVTNGLECGCICIGCRGRLSAKKGPVNQWHFSHYKDTDKINCQWSGESEVHFKVKEYLERHKQLTVPIGFSQPTRLTIKFDDIRLEKSLRPTKRIPDVTCYCSGERILIEVKVTHEVDKKKIADYKKVNASVIELDFSDFKLIGDRVTDKDIENHLEVSDLCWLSVAPVGDIAKLFQDHERSISLTLIKNNKKLEESKKKLILDVNSITDYINSFNPRYEDCKRKIEHARSLLASIRQQIHNSKIENKESIAAATSSFYNTIHQLEQDLITKLESQNSAILEQLKHESLARWNNEHQSLVKKIHELETILSHKKNDLRLLEQTLETFNIKAKKLLEQEKRLNIEVNDFKQKKLDWAKAAKANASIRNHFSRLEPDLREICSKGGIPWPFNSTLLAELSPNDDLEN